MKLPLDIPKIVPLPASYQKTPGSYVVNNGVVNCTCGELKNTVKLVVKDRGSDAGGQPICMDTDREETNFSSTFGKCSKTGKECVLSAMHSKWHIPAKVPSYLEWIPKPIPRGIYTVKDTNLVIPVTIKPVVLESSLICWHNGTAGLITVDQNGQLLSLFEQNPNGQLANLFGQNPNRQLVKLRGGNQNQNNEYQGYNPEELDEMLKDPSTSTSEKNKIKKQ